MRLNEEAYGKLRAVITELTRERDEALATERSLALNLQSVLKRAETVESELKADLKLARAEMASWRSDHERMLREWNAMKSKLALAEVAIAGAYREAAHFLDGKNGPFSPQLQEKILALTPAVAMRAEKLLVAQAKLEQAQKVITNWNIDESIRRFKVWADAEIADLTAALEEIKKERADADV